LFLLRLLSHLQFTALGFVHFFLAFHLAKLCHFLFKCLFKQRQKVSISVCSLGPGVLLVLGSFEVF